MVQNAFNTFMNHFSLDCALYICYHEDGAHVLYNDTKCEMTEAIIGGVTEIPHAGISNRVLVYQRSLISFLEHDTIGYFGQMTGVRFLWQQSAKTKAERLLTVMSGMKRYWHGSIERCHYVSTRMT